MGHVLMPLTREKELEGLIRALLGVIRDCLA